MNKIEKGDQKLNCINARKKISRNRIFNIKQKIVQLTFSQTCWPDKRIDNRMCVVAGAGRQRMNVRRTT